MQSQFSGRGSRGRGAQSNAFRGRGAPGNAFRGRGARGNAFRGRGARGTAFRGRGARGPPSNIGHERRERYNPSDGVYYGNTRKGPPLFALVKKPFRGQRDMQKFVLTALKSADMDEVVRVLGNADGYGLSKLREIVQSSFDVNGEDISFQRVLLPLCHLLASPHFENSVHAGHIRRIYTAVASEVDFMPRVLECLKKMAATKSIQDPHICFGVDDWDWFPSNWGEDVLHPVFKVLFLFLTRVTDAIADTAMPRLLEQCSECLQLWNDGSKGCINAAFCLKRASTIVLRATAVQRSTAQTILGQLEQRSEAAASPRCFVEGPGDKRPSGPHHNNDHADFRKISILPTSQEIFCTEPPFLPVKFAAGNHVDSAVDLYLDSMFRLMREDMLGSVRAAAQSLSDRSTMAHLTRQKNQSHTMVLHCSSQKSSNAAVCLNVFHDVKFESLVPSKFQGMCVGVSFNQPPAVANLSEQHQKRFWNHLNGSKMLQNNSLVCLIVPKGKFSFELLFGVVITRKKMEGSRPSVNLSLKGIGSSRLVRILRLSIDNGEAMMMFQVRGHFFASYESVLQSLQNHSQHSLPLQDVLLADIVEQFFAEDSVDRVGPLTIAAPSYVSEATRFDLRCVAKPNTADAVLEHLLAIPISKFLPLRSYLLKMRDHLVLDDTQIDAFALALSREVSLIQGPPGTGKSYVGVHVVRALLANHVNEIGPIFSQSKSALLPILCICYTNHALDQFLELLLDKGVSPNKIVRVGSRSSSEKLSARNLQLLANDQANKSEKYLLGRLIDEARFLEIDIELTQQQIQAPNKHIQQWLADRYSHHEKEMRNYGMEEGFRPARKFVKKWSALDYWLQGMDMCSYTESCNQPGEQKQYATCGAFDVLQDNVSELSSNEGERCSDNEWIDELTREDWREARESCDTGELCRQDSCKTPPEESANFQNDNSESRNERQLSMLHISEQNRPVEELLKAKNVWSMSLEERQRLNSFWMNEFAEENQEKLNILLRQYDRVCRDREELDMAKLRRVLQSCSVLGCTTSGCARYQALLEALGAPVIVCEEAGEVFESHVVAALSSRTRQLILIGDHLQLRPKPNQYILSCESGRQHNLDVSMFERLVHQFSKQKNAHTTIATLQTQRRMRPEISEILKRTLYPSLQDSAGVCQYPDAKEWPTIFGFSITTRSPNFASRYSGNAKFTLLPLIEGYMRPVPWHFQVTPTIRNHGAENLQPIDKSKAFVVRVTNEAADCCAQ